MRLEARTKRRLVALFVLIVVSILAVSYFRPRSRIAEPVSVRTTAHASSRDWQTTVAERPTPPRATRAEPEPPPIIDEVSVEKSSVCAGEENLVRVKAHTVNGTDAYLHYAIAGQAGNPVPLRVFRADDGPPPERKLSVFGRGNVATTIDVPAYRVNDCGRVPLVLVKHRSLPNRRGEFELSVHVSNTSDGFRATAYEWDFGDASSTKTGEPLVVHAYDLTKAPGIYARFLVGVTVVAEDGKRLQGRGALELLNRAEQIRLDRGVILIQAELTPRFPVRGADGTLHQRVRLFHQAEAPVTVQSLVVARIPREADSESGDGYEHLDPAGVLGSTVIPPGRGLELSFHVPQREPQVVALTYSLRGQAGSTPAQGAFSLMWPPEPPTREHSEPVASPELKAKIMSAQRILGKPIVSAEEIHDLEARGALHASPQRRF